MDSSAKILFRDKMMLTKILTKVSDKASNSTKLNKTQDQPEVVQIKLRILKFWIHNSLNSHVQMIHLRKRKLTP